MVNTGKLFITKNICAYDFSVDVKALVWENYLKSEYLHK